MKFFTITALLMGVCLLSGCTGLIDLALNKSISPEVQQAAQSPESWYTFMPHRAPGFCLRTRHAIVWEDDSMDLGYWKGLHPQPPHRVLMEARGSIFILHRRYVWDGNSVGVTTPNDLMPSLRHDALYHALKEGAPISRRAIDKAYREDCRQHGSEIGTWRYFSLRLFGGIFNRLGQRNTLIIVPTTPDSPPAPLEPDRPDDPYDDLSYTPA